MEQPTTPDVTPETRDNLLKTLEANVNEAFACLRAIQSALTFDGPLLKPEPQYTKEKLAKMLRDAYNLGATAHEESMNVRTNSWSDGIEVHIEVSDGGFSYSGDAEVDAAIIREAVDFENHSMTDEQVEEILKA